MRITVCAPPDKLEELGKKEYDVCTKVESENIDSGILLYLYEDGYQRDRKSVV